MLNNKNEDLAEFTVVDCWNAVVSRKKRILFVTFCVSLIVVVYSLMLPKYYKAEVTILPIGGRGAGGGALAALAGQFTGISSLVGGAGAAGGQLLAILRTKSLAEKVIDELDLGPVLSDAKPGDAEALLSREKQIKSLLASVEVFEDKDLGTIKLTSEFQDPKLAAKVANIYVDALQRMINENAFTSAKRYRIFIQDQLEANKRDLLEAGKGLNEFYKSGKVSSVDSRVDVPMTGGAPDGALGALNQKKTEIEEKLAVKNIPQQVYLQYLTLRRNLLVQINTMLTQQFEVAKMDESKEDLAFQVIDSAMVPEQKSKPRRAKLVITAFALSLLGSVVVSIFVEYLRRLKA